MTAIINKKKYIYIYPVNKERGSNSKTYSKRSGGRSRDKNERKERERERSTKRSETEGCSFREARNSRQNFAGHRVPRCQNTSIEAS